MTARTDGRHEPPIAVIGGGFSGVITALKLIEKIPSPQPVLLFERAPTFARGVAYSTMDSRHYLNVPAENMSAFADRPSDFIDWLNSREGGSSSGAGVFATRAEYAQYLTDRLKQALSESAGRLRLVPDAVVDLRPSASGYDIKSAMGRRYSAATVVLALGNLHDAQTEDPDGLIIANAWRKEAYQRLQNSRPVLILGTGLTMVDIAIALDGAGYKGRAVAISRRGLLPRPHARTGAPVSIDISDASRTSLVSLTRQVRAAARQMEWRKVVDGLRHQTQELWSGLPLKEKKRFLRHLRPWWDVHRHRMAPAVSAIIEKLISQNRLAFHKGRVLSLQRERGLVRANIRLQNGEAEEFIFQRVYDATGVSPLSETRDPLVKSLLKQGLARLDPLGLGFDADDTLAIQGRNTTRAGLYGIGPVLRGVFWECTAVPDIREQAAKLSETLSEAFHRTPA